MFQLQALTLVVESAGLMIVKEAGPEIFVQSHSLIFPSVSLDVLPSNKTLSAGKVSAWSGPAITIGGLLPSLHPSHEYSFLQEIKIATPTFNDINKKMKILL